MDPDDFDNPLPLEPPTEEELERLMAKHTSLSPEQQDALGEDCVDILEANNLTAGQKALLSVLMMSKAAVSLDMSNPEIAIIFATMASKTLATVQRVLNLTDEQGRQVLDLAKSLDKIPIAPKEPGHE